MADDRLSVYDSDDDACRNFGENRSASRKLAITGGVAGFTKSWQGFAKSPGGQYSRVVFDTHGNAGMIFFNGEALRWGDVSTVFGGKDYRNIFPSFTRVCFGGCNVAEGDFGWLFLQEVGKALCQAGGGVVFGWASKGYTLKVGNHALPHKWVHPTGDVRYVVMAKGGTVDDMFTATEVVQGLFPPRFGGSGELTRRYQIMSDDL